MLLADGVSDAIGHINQPVGPSIFQSDPQQALGIVIAKGISAVILLASMFMLFYLLWGAFDWVVSSGEKERITKAQQKITNAIIGLLLMIVVISLFGVITGNILGIVKLQDGGWVFTLPSIGP